MIGVKTLFQENNVLSYILNIRSRLSAITRHCICHNVGVSISNMLYKPSLLLGNILIISFTQTIHQVKVKPILL